MSQSPEEPPGGLDPRQFVGEPPTGEQDPGGFTSGDQSTGAAEAPQQGDQDGDQDGDQEEDAS